MNKFRNTIRFQSATAHGIYRGSQNNRVTLRSKATQIRERLKTLGLRVANVQNDDVRELLLSTSKRFGAVNRVGGLVACCL